MLISGRDYQPRRRSLRGSAFVVRRPGLARARCGISSQDSPTFRASWELGVMRGTGSSVRRDRSNCTRSARSVLPGVMPLPHQAIYFFTFAASISTFVSSWGRRSWHVSETRFPWWTRCTVFVTSTPAISWVLSMGPRTRLGRRRSTLCSSARRMRHLLAEAT